MPTFICNPTCVWDDFKVWNELEEVEDNDENSSLEVPEYPNICQSSSQRIKIFPEHRSIELKRSEMVLVELVPLSAQIVCEQSFKPRS